MKIKTKSNEKRIAEKPRRVCRGGYLFMRNKKTTDKRVRRVSTRTDGGGVQQTPVFHREKVRVFSPGPRRFKEKTSSMPPIVVGIFSCQFVVPFSVKKKHA